MLQSNQHSTSQNGTTSARRSLRLRGGPCRRHSHRRHRSELHQQIADSHCATLIPASDGKSAALQYDHGREHTLRTARQEIDIKAQQTVPGANPLPLLHVQLEALPAQCHRVDSHMEQDLGTLGCPQRYRMPGGRNRDQFAVARSVQRRAGGIDRKAVTEHSSGKHRIGSLIERRAPTGQGRNQDYLRHPLIYSWSWTQSSAHIGSRARWVNRRHRS